MESYFGRACGKIDLAGGKIILASGKITLAGGKIKWQVWSPFNPSARIPE